MGLPSLASIKVTYDFLAASGAEPLAQNLGRLVSRTHDLLQSLVLRRRPLPELLQVSRDAPKSPIVPLFTSHPRSLARHCQQRGFMVRPIVAPTVPVGSERVRICLHAGNTVVEVEALARAVEEWLEMRMEEGEVQALDKARL